VQWTVHAIDDASLSQRKLFLLQLFVIQEQPLLLRWYPEFPVYQ
jgi:hypothetical protein